MATSESSGKIQLSFAWQAFLFPFKNVSALLRLALLPTLISAAIVYAIYRVTVPQYGTHSESIEDLTRLEEEMALTSSAALVLSTIVAVIVAVGVHRLILRGETPGWTILRLRRYELAYAGAVALFVVASSAAQYLVLAIGWLFGTVDPAALGSDAWIWPEHYIFQYARQATPALIATVAVLAAALIWLHIRLALVFPHAAVTGRISLGESWTAMRGNVWRFVGGSILLGLLLMLFYLLFAVVMVAALIFDAPAVDAVSSIDSVKTLLLPALVGVLTNGLIVAMIVAFVSYIYRDLADGSASARQMPDGRQGAAFATA